MELITVSFLVLITILSIWFAFNRHRYAFNYWKKRNIPHIEPSVPYGNLEGVGEKFHIVYMIKRIYDKFRGTGAKYCGAYFYTRPIALIMDLDLIKDILVKDFANFPDRGLYSNPRDDPLSSNLSTLDGDEWRKLRSKLTAAFTSGRMKFMFPTVVKIAERLRDTLNENASLNNDESLEIRDYMLRFTADVIGTCAFGIECNSLKDKDAEFITMARLGADKHRHSQRFLALITSFKNTARMLRIKSLRDDVAAFFMNVVHETIEDREKNNTKRRDFMDILLSLRNQATTVNGDALTINEIAAQTSLFFLAGFDTTAITLTNCLFELAQNPDVQKKARIVIKEAYEKYNNQFTYKMMMDMPYILQLVQETLRKYPVSSSVNRIAKINYRVAGTEQVIEKGTWIKVPVHAIHQDPTYYPEPEKFDPERFDSAEVKKRHPMTWLPFGDGPRGCIGSRFALMQVQIGIVVLLMNFEFSVCAETVDTIVFDPQRSLLSVDQGLILEVHPICM